MINKRATILFLLFLVFGAVSAVQAQSPKIGYVDGQTVYNQLPEVKAATNQLETYGKQLQKEIQDKQTSLETKYKDYQEKSGTMTDAMRTATEKELQGLQEQLQIKQRDSQAALNKKEGELLKPIEEKIQKAIKEVATENGFAYIFNKEMLLHFPAGDDISPMVLKKLGVTASASNTQTTVNKPK